MRKKGVRYVPELLPFPPMVRLEITTKCNLHCAHCPNSLLSETAGFLSEMDGALYCKIVDEIAAESPNTLLRPFGGGEPLTRRNIGELLSYAKNKGIKRMSINTNGTLLDARKRSELIAGGITHIEVSLDAVTPETYLRIRQAPVFDKVVANVLAYITESKKYDHRNQVDVSFVLQKDNVHEVEAFKKYWSSKVDRIHIRQYHQHGGLVEKRSDVGRKTLSNRHPCGYLWQRMIVNHNGKVPFCENDWEGRHAIGDARTHCIRDIWNGDAYKKLRAQHIQGTFDHPYCRECPDWSVVAPASPCPK